METWELTAASFNGHFLGVDVGTALERKLSKLAIPLFGIAVLFAIIVPTANTFTNDIEVIIYAVSTGLITIPASLMVISTVTTTAAIKRMFHFVRKLNLNDALGAVTDT